MTVSFHTRILACILLTACAAGHAQPTSPPPFFKARDHQATYAGPEGETVSATDVDEVPIGYFGPANPDHPTFGGLWWGAQLAVCKANRAGGFQGKPFRLIPAWSADPWGTGIKQLTSLVYKHNVWAIIGGVDGPSTHLAEQVVAKARLPLVSPLSTDKTVNLANVPWAFSLAPGDHLIAPKLAEAVATQSPDGNFTILATDDHDAHVFVDELRKAFARLKLAPAYQLEYAHGDKNLEPLVREVLRHQPEVIVVAADVPDTARMVRTLRSAGFSGALFTGPAAGYRSFVASAGRSANGVRFPLLAEPSGTLAAFFRMLPPDAPGGKSDFTIAFGYDAAKIVIKAIRTAGLNRVGIRNAIQRQTTTKALTGTIRWDGLGANQRPVRLATFENGKLRIEPHANVPSPP